MKILGLDISSSTVGWAIIEKQNSDIKIINYGHIKTSKTRKLNLFERFSLLKKDLDKIVLENKPDMIAAEDILFAFTKGRSTASTIVILASFNRVSLSHIYDHFNIPIKLYAPISIRSRVGKLCKTKMPDKDEIPEYIIKFLGSFTYKYNKNKNIAVQSYDEADAIAVAWVAATDIK